MPNIINLKQSNKKTQGRATGGQGAGAQRFSNNNDNTQCRDAKFCVSTIGTQSMKNKKRPRLKTRAPIIVLIGLIILAVAAVIVIIVSAGATNVEQEGFRFRDDDNNEANATWLAEQDIDITREKNTNTRLRVLLDSGEDVPSQQYQLEAQITGGSYKKITASSTQTIVEDYTITGSHTWVAPQGVTDIQVELWGNGGNGGGLTTDYVIARGGGGAGGQYVVDNSVAVTPGTSYTIAVGLIKSGGTGDGSVGNNSTFNINTVVAKGGAGGQSYENGFAAGTGSVAGGVGDTVYAGGDGSAGGTGATGGAGGGGAGTTGEGGDASGNTAGTGTALYGGAGGAGRTTSFYGNEGTQAGGGGGSGANVTDTLTTNRNGGYGAAGRARITYTAAVPYLNNSGAGDNGTTQLDIPYPTGLAFGDFLITAVVNKYSSSTPATPSGWDLAATVVGGDNPSYLTDDQGDVRTTVFVKEAAGTETGNLIVTIDSGNSAYGRIFNYRKSGGKDWSYATSTGADNTAGWAWSVTGDVDPGITTKDVMVAVSGSNTDFNNFSAEAMTATGITWGSQKELADTAASDGLDTRLVVSEHWVNSGVSSAAPVYVMTANSSGTNNPEGSTVFLRLREVIAPIQLSLSANIAASAATPTTVQLTPPASGSFEAGWISDDTNPMPAIDLGNGNYTELEWSLIATDATAESEVYQFRVTIAGTVLDTYTVTPQWTIGTPEPPASPSVATPSIGLLADYSLASSSLKSATVMADLTPNGHDGTITAGAGGFTTDQKSQANQAYDFDGADTKIDTASDWIGTSALTTSVWIYLDSFGENNNGRIIDNGKIYLTATSTNNVLSFSSDGSTKAVSANSSLTTGQWYFVAVTRAADGTANLYINGVLSGTANQSSGTPVAGTSNVIIGNNFAQGATFDGHLSDLKVYNRVLSVAEITQLYQSYNPSIVISSIEKGLLADYSLASDSLKSTTVMADLTPNGHDGTITAGASAGFTTDQKSQANQAYDFDGADTTIVTNLTSNSEFQNGFTVSAWIYPESVGENNYGRIVDKCNDVSGASGFRYNMSNTGNKLDFNINAHVSVISSATDSITFNQWQHVLVTVASDATITHYINGVVSGTPGASGALSGITSNNPITIGNRANATDRTFDGRLSDLKVYNRVLSQEEITQLYQSYNPSFVIPSIEKGLLADYSLASSSLKSTTVMADLTPNGHDGAITAGAGGFTTDQKSQANQAYDFDGVDTIIDAGSDWIGTSALTTSAWIYLDGYGEGGVGRIIDNGKTVFRLISAANPRLTFTSDGATYKDSANDSMQLNTWYHVVVTRTAAGVANIYVNGVLSGTADQSSGTPEAGATNVIIGNDSAGGATFDGHISDLKVYNRVLSATEIQQLYRIYR